MSPDGVVQAPGGPLTCRAGEVRGDGVEQLLARVAEGTSVLRSACRFARVGA